MKDSMVMNLVSFGVFLVLGPGLFYVISGYIDCSQAAVGRQSFCESFKTVGTYMIVPAISGVVLTAYVALIAKPESNNKETYSRSPIT